MKERFAIFIFDRTFICSQKSDDLSGLFSTLLAEADALRAELSFIAPNKNLLTIADGSF
jgi:hypothetical protein